LNLRLLLDEDCQLKALTALLRSRGHDVATVAEEGLMACEDRAILERAHSEGRTLLTRNADHFRDLHDSGVTHSGILVVYLGSDPSKNMGREDIARALANLAASGLALSGDYVVLNAWKY